MEMSRIRKKKSAFYPGNASLVYGLYFALLLNYIHLTRDALQYQTQPKDMRGAVSRKKKSDSLILVKP